MKFSTFSKIPFSNVMLAFALLSAAALSAQSQTLQCVETNGVKFRLPPNIDGGLDVKDSRDNIVLADDFPCTTTGPISDIHLWGSWLSDNHGLITNFWLGIYNDVPAVTNAANAQITPSHPGTNLLWQQSFGLGQYVESPYATGSEYFYNPTNNLIVGGDSQAWYYCFYPTNPFVQQGTAVNPTNYWLAVRAQISDQTPTALFGWKTSLIPYNDAAVWGTVQPATGLPIGNWQSMTNPINQQKVDLSFKLTTPTNSTPPTQCVETNGVKFLLPPQAFDGLDVKDSRDNIVLADDFYCNTTGPITDIHLWGSWLNDQHGTITNFWIGIYNDVPAVTNFTGGQITPSHPGTNLLWQQSFVLGQYAESIYTQGQEYFYNPTNNQIMGGDQLVWYYCFYPTNPFVQQGTANNPTNYWLAVSAQISDPATLFGWKSSISNYNDAAVWGTVLPTSGLPIGNWQSMTNPITQQKVDLSFKLTTPTNSPPPAQCVETNGVKYVQGPNLNGGYDVWNGPYVLADDFACTNIGPISDIHIWGSWLNDQASTNSIIFWLGIYNDVPVDPGNTFSHPGTNLLWQQWFTPGQYAETIWTANASEQFLDPGQPPTSGPQIIGSDSKVWYYCFYPTNPFVQQGSTANSKTYWLAAYAQLPAGANYNYGWKTTTNVQHDISVHALWPGFGPTNNPGWVKTSLPNGAPLDLAFKLTTPTNPCGPIIITHLATNKVVMSWPSGFLQSSTNVIGPYVDVPGAMSPYTNATVAPPPYKFYRLRCY